MDATHLRRCRLAFMLAQSDPLDLEYEKAVQAAGREVMDEHRERCRPSQTTRSRPPAYSRWPLPLTPFDRYITLTPPYAALTPTSVHTISSA